MSTLTRKLIVLALFFNHGCDTEEEFGSPEPSELDAPGDPEAATPPTELDAYGWSEAPAEYSDLELAPPVTNGTCGGYWENKPGPVDLQGCGTCMHTIPEPDRAGNLGLWWKRWCWTGNGCWGCEPWVVSSTKCYDSCS